MTRRIMDFKLEGSRRVGGGDQTFGGWRDGVMEDMRKMGMVARDKQS
jgi:hypothetical protein